MTGADDAAGSPAADAILELIGDTMGLLDLAEFRHGLLHALRRAVPADYVALNDVGPDPDSVWVIIDPPAPSALFSDFARYAEENPLIRAYAATRDGRALRFSDLVTREQLQATALYRRVYRPMGVEFQIAFTLPSEAGRVLGVALSRRRRDFGDAERDLLNAARPFLIQAYRNAVRFSERGARGRALSRAPQPETAKLRQLGLTDRQAEILGLLAAGASAADIAGRLGISRRTVEKHLERCYRTLGVSGRAEAVDVAAGPGRVNLSTASASRSTPPAPGPARSPARARAASPRRRAAG